MTIPRDPSKPARSHEGALVDGPPSTGLTVVLAVVLLSAPLTGCLGFDPPGDAGDDETSEPSPSQASEPTRNPGNASSSDDGSRTPAEETGPRRNESAWLGAWLGAWPSSENREISTFNERSGDRLDVVDVMASWNTSYASLRGSLTNIASADARPLITWNPANLTTREIANGSTELRLDDNSTATVDEYVASFADGLCDYTDHTGTPPLLEPMPEPNGDWHTWSIGYETEDGHRPNTNESYGRAWTHVYEIFQQRCPDGVEFVWTVNGANRGSGTSYMGAFPGADETDLAGIRGINLGSFQPRGWAAFGETYGDAYCNVTGQTDLNVVLTAVGSVEQGGDKAGWIGETYRNASSHAWHRIEGLVWYDDELVLDSETVDLSLDSSLEALDAYRSAADRVRSDSAPEGASPPC